MPQAIARSYCPAIPAFFQRSAPNPKAGDRQFPTGKLLRAFKRDSNLTPSENSICGVGRGLGRAPEPERRALEVDDPAREDLTRTLAEDGG